MAARRPPRRPPPPQQAASPAQVSGVRHHGLCVYVGHLPGMGGGTGRQPGAPAGPSAHGAPLSCSASDPAAPICSARPHLVQVVVLWGLLPGALALALPRLARATHGGAAWLGGCLARLPRVAARLGGLAFVPGGVGTNSGAAGRLSGRAERRRACGLWWVSAVLGGLERTHGCNQATCWQLAAHRGTALAQRR